MGVCQWIEDEVNEGRTPGRKLTKLSLVRYISFTALQLPVYVPVSAI